MRPPGYHIFAMIDYTKRLLQLVKTLSPVDRQNRLMATPDRELALAMMYMDEPDRKKFLSVVSIAKRRRIEDELRLESHLSIRYEHFRRAMEAVMVRLYHSATSVGDAASPGSSNGRPAPLRSYLRPRRDRRVG
ncbi:MAG TPA: hypothetical protein VMW87_05085 [Spirochaetia bacterium]|nr:hypothetical protein [Spirochaetia bacterium]